MSSTQQSEDELMKALKVFQDYTASWGYPMNTDPHIRGIKIAYERVQDLITRARLAELESIAIFHGHYKRSMLVDKRITELQNQLNSKENK